MAEALRSDDPAKLGPNLITCGGAFDVRSEEYQSRVLVFAVAE